ASAAAATRRRAAPDMRKLRLVDRLIEPRRRGAQLGPSVVPRRRRRRALTGVGSVAAGGPSGPPSRWGSQGAPKWTLGSGVRAGVPLGVPGRPQKDAQVSDRLPGPSLLPSDPAAPPSGAPS